MIVAYDCCLFMIAPYAIDIGLHQATCIFVQIYSAYRIFLAGFVLNNPFLLRDAAMLARSWES